MEKASAYAKEDALLSKASSRTPAACEPAPGIHLPEEKCYKGVLHFNLLTYHLVLPHSPGKVVRSRLCPASKEALWLAWAPGCCPANYKICMFFAPFLSRCCCLLFYVFVLCF